MQSHHQWKTSKLAFLLFKSITANIKKEKIFPVLGLSMSRYFSIMQQTIRYICAHQLSRWRGEMNMCRQVQNLASRQFRQRNSWSFGGRRHNTDPLWNPLLSLSPASTYMFFSAAFFLSHVLVQSKRNPQRRKIIWGDNDIFTQRKHHIFCELFSMKILMLMLLLTYQSCLVCWYGPPPWGYRPQARNWSPGPFSSGPST